MKIVVMCVRVALILHLMSFTTTFSYRLSCSPGEVCLPLTQCASELKYIHKIQSDLKVRQRQQSIICGFQGLDVKVCCKSEPEPESEYTETAPCGRRRIFTGLIAGGDDTVPGEWPWTVVLNYSEEYRRCGGVLISARHVLTAAHCMEEGLQGVVLGEHNLSTTHDCLDPDYGCDDSGPQCLADGLCAPPSVEAKISSVTIHPNYDSGLGFAQFDVAILTLMDRVKFTDFIQPVCLPSPNNRRENQSPITVVGWGLEGPSLLSQELSTTLKKLHVRSIPLWTCNQKYKAFTDRDLKPSHICASTLNHGRSACRGDSGGPLLREIDSGEQYEVAGVMSLGSRICGNIDIPLIFTRVEGEVNTWIRREVGERELPVRPDST